MAASASPSLSPSLSPSVSPSASFSPSVSPSLSPSLALYLEKFDMMQEGTRYSRGIRTGIRTAVDFTITLGFRPSKIRVVNLTDRVEAEYHVDPGADDSTVNLYGLDAGANAKSLVTAADGTRTYAASGISLTDDGMGFTVDVSVASLETDNDETIWEAWG